MPPANFRYRILNSLIVMGAMWIIAGLALAASRPLWALILAVAVALALTLVVRRSQKVLRKAWNGAPQGVSEENGEETAAQERGERAWWRRITIAEFLFVFLAVWVTELRQRIDLLLVGVAAVVALHFEGLAFVFRRKRALAARFATEGVLMLALVAVAGTVAGADWRNFWIGIGMGAILWLSVLVTLYRPSV